MKFIYELKTKSPGCCCIIVSDIEKVVTATGAPFPQIGASVISDRLITPSEAWSLAKSLKDSTFTVRCIDTNEINCLVSLLELYPTATDEQLRKAGFSVSES